LRLTFLLPRLGHAALELPARDDPGPVDRRGLHLGFKPHRPKGLGDVTDLLHVDDGFHDALHWSSSLPRTTWVCRISDSSSTRVALNSSNISLILASCSTSFFITSFSWSSTPNLISRIILLTPSTLGTSTRSPSWPCCRAARSTRAGGCASPAA